LPSTPATPDRAPADWWERSDRHYDASGQLWIGGCAAAALVAQHGTPAYVYSAARVTQNVARLRLALSTLERPTRLFYAMKSNRFAPLLRHLRGLGVGIDACSPGEVRHALACGFSAGDISFTAGSLSRADYQALAGWPELTINADSLTALRRFAEVAPNRRLGLRVNPGLGLGYADNPKLQYAGVAPGKFGVYFDRFREALELADRLGLRLERLHCHAGCGFLTPQLPSLAGVFERLQRFLDAAPQIRRINLGGGLGIPLRAEDRELDLDAWAALVREFFGARALDEIAVEPGDYLVKDAGTLLTEVTQVEEKGGRVFVGVNAGFNLHPEPVFYHLPLVPVPAQRAEGAAQTVTVAGNINEALDLWAQDASLPPLREGDVLCWLNAGGYGASMASQHCLRGEFSEHLIEPEPAALAADTQQLSHANRRAWDALYAATRDLVWGSDPLPFLAEFHDEFVAALRRPSRLLDAGVGEGRNLHFLLDCHADETHAIDASLHALAKIPAVLASRLQPRQGELGATGYPDAYFDGLTLLDTIETLPDASAVLAEMFRILKPGGLLLCNIPGLDDGVAGVDMRSLSDNAYLYRSQYYFRFIEPADAEAMLREAGFEVRRSVHRSWVESGHPGFRDETHTHVSHVLLAQRPMCA